MRVHLAVLTLGYSRRLLVRAFRSEKQDHWLQTLEEGFRHWGGVPQEVLVDNARGRALYAVLRTRLPGYLVPRLARETPGQTAKDWLLP